LDKQHVVWVVLYHQDQIVFKHGNIFVEQDNAFRPCGKRTLGRNNPETNPEKLHG
jgi:hypothetical protein